MVDIDDAVKILDVFTHKPGRKRVIASKAGYGFILPEDEAIAFRRAGKQVLTVDDAGACISLAAEGDHLAVIGDNGKILVFKLDELPEMVRGKGVKLQSYREGGLRDALVFTKAIGPSWIDSAGRNRAWTDWNDFVGRRSSAGKIAPRGFAANKRFRP
jgi:topoisomerase-4 subunit A